MKDAADYLRNAAESDVTADEAWENQQQLNQEIELSHYSTSELAGR
jgi:hypothetical protein